MTAADEPLENDMINTIMQAGQICGWRIAHFRPALTRHGWRTAVQGDGAGFPDLVAVHPVGKRVLFVEVKAAKGRLAVDQEQWAASLIQAGAEWMTVRGKAGMDEFVDMLAAAPTGRPTPSGEMLADILARALP